jgi:hypothetical protein
MMDLTKKKKKKRKKEKEKKEGMIFGDPPGHDNLVTRLPLYIHPSSFQSATQTLLDCTLYLSHAIPSACPTPPPPPLSSAIHVSFLC